MSDAHLLTLIVQILQAQSVCVFYYKSVYNVHFFKFDVLSSNIFDRNYSLIPIIAFIKKILFMLCLGYYCIIRKI